MSKIIAFILSICLSSSALANCSIEPKISEFHDSDPDVLVKKYRAAKKAKREDCKSAKRGKQQRPSWVQKAMGELADESQAREQKDRIIDETFLAAMQNKDFELASTLIDAGANPDKAKNYIFRYVKNADYDGLEYLFDNLNLDVNYRKYHESQLTIRFVSYSLREYGGEMRKLILNRNTPVYYSLGNEQLFKFLIDSGADVNMKYDINEHKGNSYHATKNVNLLHLLISAGSHELVKYLLDGDKYTIDINEDLVVHNLSPQARDMKNKVNRLSPLHLANANIGIVRGSYSYETYPDIWESMQMYLLSKGADIKPKQLNGQKTSIIEDSMIFSCSKDKDGKKEKAMTNVINKLIDKGAPVKMGLVKLATKKKCKEIARQLLSHALK